MILLTGYYEDADMRRQAEFLECLRRNCENLWLDEIHLFIEDACSLDRLRATHPAFAHAKLRLIAHGRRATYQEFFSYANRYLPGQQVLLANADIYFDHTLARLTEIDWTGQLFCLSRWDVQPDGTARFFEHPYSQDVWGFLSPLQDFSCRFPLGVRGCDNRLAWEAAQAGLNLLNPGRSVRAHHLHLSQIRRHHQRQRVAGPFKPVPAVALASPYPSERGPAPDAALASVAFRETMGYTLARLERGLSSHNNEPRPFTIIPAPLTDLPYTQVVAYAVTPVEVEFLTAGKLYVLVGNDWDGYHTATDWLAQTGFREALPLVETHSGMGFEVWSLVAAAGERFVLPTQMMLVAERLVKDAGSRPPVLFKAEGHQQHADVAANGVALQNGARRGGHEKIFALTSLAPAHAGAAWVRECLASWRAAGLEVRAFNHPQEIAQLAPLYDVEFVPVTDTSAEEFGKHFIPINAMLDWADTQRAPVLLINSDIRLRLEPWELKRLRWLSEGGLCYFVRYNHNGDLAQAEREPYGIDAFLFHGRHAAHFPASCLSMGQPFWDYWVPYTFAAQQLPIYALEFPAAFHRTHPLHWSQQHWQRCALEFARMTGELGAEQTYEACVGMSLRVRQQFDQHKISLPAQPWPIQNWVQQTFQSPGPKTFLELGAHRGTDTTWLAAIPGVTLHAFEPDPRNWPPPRHNVALHRAAIAERDGRGPLIVSQRGWGQEWTYSSSIKLPKNHLRRYPVTFGETIEVELVTLDTFTQKHGLEVIDFIWADIQGAEGEMIRGGRRTLERTRYLYTEYSDDEMYERQSSLAEILALLPEFGVVELWPDEVLLENRKLKRLE